MAQSAQLRRFEVIENEAQRVFQLQRDAYLRAPYPSYEVRVERLDKLERILLENRAAIAAAINEDFGNRCEQESQLLEIVTSVDGVRQARKQLRKWMKPQKRHVSILFATGKNRVIPQPKGVVGIVSPWNYPLFLTVSPLTSILAAGNRAMIKMATNSSTLCAVLAEKFSAVFDESEVAILPGVRGADFSTLPYDHMIFTGSAEAGRTVMRSAAENLTPVTLELGGKSPTVICDDFDVKDAASRILYAKLLNAGQTCLAPDYLFVPEGKRNAFVDAAREVVARRYPDLNDPGFTSVIDDKSYRRLRETLEDAEEQGATLVPLVPGGSSNDVQRKLLPHLVLDVTDDMRIMREEIFGPLFPVKTYRSLDEVIEYVNVRDRPLGFYLFTHDKAVQEKLLYGTISGGVTINHCMFHAAQHDMPFGGVGASGMGHYHGFDGFVEFSKMRPVFTSPKMDPAALLHPPYGPRQGKIVDFLLKYLR